MKKIILSILLFTAFDSASAQLKNIKLAEVTAGSYPSGGPCIVINRKNPKNIVAGVSPNLVIYSNDEGKTWSEKKLQSQFGVSIFSALVSGNKGDIYSFLLTDPSGKGKVDDGWLDRIICEKSTDDGSTWKSGEPFGNNPGKDQYRVSVTTAPKKQELYATWTQLDKFDGTDTSFHSNIMLSQSDSEGKKWSKSIQINQVAGDCSGGDNTAMGATAVVDLKGKIFVAWANKGVIYLDRSYDNGRTWLNNDIMVAQQPGGWELDIPGTQHCNGLPVMILDSGPSRYHGGIYLLWADQRNGKDDSDIWFMRSGNGGDNWSTPIRVNKDEKGKQQFSPSMSVDQTTGHIYVIYYDQRNYEDLQTDVYLAYSTDGGSTFDEVKLSDTSFTLSTSGFAVEQNNITAHGGVIVPVWTRLDDNKASVWTVVIKEADLTKK